MPGRILLLTNRVPYPLRDGGALAMDTMIRGYHDAGWQAHLLAMNTTRHHVPQEKLDKLYPQLAGFDTVEVDNRVRAISLIKNLLFSREPEHAVRFRSEAKSFGRNSIRTYVMMKCPFRKEIPHSYVLYRAF